MKLYTYFRSSAAYRVRIALNLKGLPYELAPVNLVAGEQRQADYTARNPQGLVPALELADGTVLGQSIAILEWLEEAHPDSPLLPADPVARATVRSMCNHVACEIHPLNNLRVMNYLKQELDRSQEQVGQWYSHWVQLGFNALEAMVSEHGGQYCFGDQPGLADCYLVPQMYNARRFEVDVSAFGGLCEIVERCNALDAFQQAAPERQPDCP